MRDTRLTQQRAVLGMSLHEAAKKARLSPSYLTQIERAGYASYPAACRLAHLYNCPIESFLRRKKELL